MGLPARGPRAPWLIALLLAPVALAHAPVPAGPGLGAGALLLVTLQDDPGETRVCTAGFVWTSGADAYLSTAGHCLLPEGRTATHGAGADHDPSRTVVRACLSCAFTGGTLAVPPSAVVALGPVAYARQTGPGGDLGQDFGLVKVPVHLLPLGVSCAVPVWGGPRTVGSAVLGAPLGTYGHGAGVGETLATKARAGTGTAMLSPSAWAGVLPAGPGDDGAPVVTLVRDASGVHGHAAVGILTHTLVGQPGTVGGTTVQAGQFMAARDAALALTLCFEP